MARKSKRESDDRRFDDREYRRDPYYRDDYRRQSRGNYRSEENRGYQQEEYRRDYGSMTDVTSRDTVRTDTEETAATVRVIRAAAMTTGTMNRMTEENVQQRKRRENGSRLSLKS